MTPTPEQADAVAKFQTGGTLKINAFAGTGKTTTLRLLASATNRRGMYLAFNKAIADDAKARFPPTVSCSTIHSLAFRGTPRAFQHGDKMTGSMNANAVADHLGYRAAYVDGLHLSARSQGHLTLETLRKFMQGGRAAPDERHVPTLGKLGTLGDDTLARIRSAAVIDAAHLWRRMCDPVDSIPLGYDGYLKLWAMSRPILQADFVLMDEAQDTNPVILEMLRHQRAQIVYVGDRHQQIYEWRGAVNAMEHIRAAQESHLTTSFRFGESIANAASQVIARLGETRLLTGNAAVTSYLGSDAADAIIARTNASVVSAVLRQMELGRNPHVVGGTSDLIRMLRGVEALKRNEPSDVAEFFGFANWGEVVEHSKMPEGERLRTFVRLVEQHGETRLIGKLNETAQDERGSDVVVSTAHKAKGREWDTVSLADDFLPPQPGQEPEAPPEFDQAEIRLFYVALTRAKIAVDVSPTVLAHFGLKPGPRYSAPAFRELVRSLSPQSNLSSDPVSTAHPKASTPPPRGASAPDKSASSGLFGTIGRWLWLPIAFGVLKMLFS
jgi:hypothetical protein